MKFSRIFSATNFLLIFFCFFLPFVRSCGHEEKAEATSKDSSQVKKEDTTYVLQAKNSCVNYFEVPCNFYIDDGDLDSTATITVQKGSTIVQKITAEKEFNLKLDFNVDYTLIFSQQGYISKEISINTTILNKHIQYAFAYPFLVILFKQKKGLDTTIFMDPLAKAKAKAKEEAKAKIDEEKKESNILLNFGNHLMYPSYPDVNDISGFGLLVIWGVAIFYLLLFLSVFIFTILGFVFSLLNFIKKEKRLFQFSIIVFLCLMTAPFLMPKIEYEKLLYGYWITLALAFLNMLINGIIFRIHKIKK